MHILIVSEFFAPVRSIGSIRWTKLAKYLAKNHNVKIDLLTNFKRYSTEQRPSTYFYDEQAVKETTFLDQVITIPTSICVKATNLLFDAVYKMIGGNASSAEADPTESESHLETLLRSLYEHAYSSILSMMLTIRTNSIAKSAKRIHLDYSKYDAVISSSPPVWTHKIASQIKGVNEDIFWIADYRDPSNNMSDIPRKHKKDTVEAYSKDADIVLMVWKNEPGIMNVPDTIRSGYIPNGYDPEEASLRTRLPLDSFRISYTGSLVLEHDLTPLFIALSNLADRNEIDVSKIEVAYAGSTSNAFQAMIKDFPLLSRTDHGFLARNDALDLQNSSAILISCAWNTETYKTGIGGKLFELISSSIPVVGLCAGKVPDSPLKQFLSATNTGYCYEEADSSTNLKELETYILERYHEWQRTGTTRTDPNTEELEKFQHDHLADQIYKMIEGRPSQD